MLYILSTVFYISDIIIARKLLFMLSSSPSSLPSWLRKFLWSYEFERVDPERHKTIIIVNVINYGDLQHWQWLGRFYGRDTVRRVLSDIPVTEITPSVRRLTARLFGVPSFRYALRGTR
jgi:hypothetical protein